MAVANVCGTDISELFVLSSASSTGIVGFAADLLMLSVVVKSLVKGSWELGDPTGAFLFSAGSGTPLMMFCGAVVLTISTLSEAA
jgi:hypothetical protein